MRLTTTSDIKAILPDYTRKIRSASVAAHIEAWLKEDGRTDERCRSTAREFIGVLDEAGGMILKETEAFCPSCTSVCCINRHSYHEVIDIFFITAAGGTPPGYRPDISDLSPCQFLGEKGCMLPRPLRPYRCTWYFCGPLLEHIRSGPARRYRIFSDSMMRLTEKRQELIGCYIDVLERADDNLIIRSAR